VDLLDGLDCFRVLLELDEGTPFALAVGVSEDGALLDIAEVTEHLLQILLVLRLPQHAHKHLPVPGNPSRSANKTIFRIVYKYIGQAHFVFTKELQFL